MRRLALFALACVVLLAALGAAPGAPAAERPSAADLEAELVCPSCKTTLDQSDAPVARRMKAYVRARLAAGASADEIKRELVDQFGPLVLASPPTRGFHLLAWALPLAGLALGGLLVGALAWAWSSRRSTLVEQAVPIDPELEHRVDEELARFEG